MIECQLVIFNLSIIYVHINEKASVCVLFYTLIKKGKLKRRRKGHISKWSSHLLSNPLFFLKTCILVKICCLFI